MGLNEGRNGDFETGTPSWASATGVPSPPPGSVAIVGDALPAAAGVAVAPRGRLFRVLNFTLARGKIVQVEVISDSVRLGELDLSVLE